MNYYICDDITWKKSLSLLKNDMEGQRVMIYFVILEISRYFAQNLVMLCILQEQR